MNYPWIYRGFDPTSVVGTPTNSQLLQMVAEAKPTFKQAGMFVISVVAPDVATYPDLAFAIWLELNVGQTALTGNQFYHNGTTWVPVPIADNSITNDSIVDGTIEIDKLSVAGNSAVSEIIAVNAGRTAFEFTTVAALLANGSIAYSKLVAPIEGDILYGNGSNQWTATPLAPLVEAAINDMYLPISLVRDTTTAYAEGQVPAITTPGGFMQPFYVEELLRNNLVPTQKLNFGGVGNAGKYMTVNGAGTDVAYVTPASGVSIAQLAYTGVAGTAPEQTVAGVAKTLSWTGTSEVDPDNIVTLAANQLTFAATGYYLLQVVLPVSGTALGRLYLYNVTSAAEVAGTNTPFRSFFNSGQGEQGTTVVANLLVNIANSAHVYEVRVKTSSGVYFSLYLNAGGYNYDGGAERYQQLTITKLS